MSLSPSAKPWRRAQRGPQPLRAEPPAAAPRLAGQRGTPTAAFRPENTPSTARTARRELPHPPPPGPEVTQFPQKTPNPAGPPPGASSSRPQAGNPAAADLCRIAAPGPAPVPPRPVPLSPVQRLGAGLPRPGPRCSCCRRHPRPPGAAPHHAAALPRRPGRRRPLHGARPGPALPPQPGPARAPAAAESCQRAAGLTHRPPRHRQGGQRPRVAGEGGRRRG